MAMDEKPGDQATSPRPWPRNLSFAARAEIAMREA
jgi:hypothetical protein